MKYIARAAVTLSDGYTLSTENQWNLLKTVEDIEYRWRIRNGNVYEVLAGTFCNQFDALKCAKQMYVKLLYTFYHLQLAMSDTGSDYYYSNYDSDITGVIEDRSHVFWNAHYQGCFSGPGVYEVENSIDDFDGYRFLSGLVKVSIPSDELLIDNIDQYIFAYNSQSHDFLRQVHLAESAHNHGMQMTIYCGLLEHMAEEGYKSEESQKELDELIEHVEQSALTPEEKQQLKQYLGTGKKLSARQKCAKLLEKYGKKYYGPYTAKKILDAAYSARSAFAHGSTPTSNEITQYVKFVALDVIKTYMRKKEGLDA